MRYFDRSFLVVLTWLATLGAGAADLPELALPAGVGVNIHFTKGHEQDLDLIAAAGFKFVRIDFSWAGTERKRGQYEWGAYDELTANLQKRGLRAVFILDYSNGLYEEAITVRDHHTGKDHKDTASPQHPESIAAFARWAAAAAEHFKTRRVVWEIWNEPNITFWKPKPDAAQYAALALATAQAVRRADPQATLIAPGSSGFPWEFFETMFQAGVLAYLDGVSVHPYRNYNKSPETAAEDYARLRALIARYTPAGKTPVPVISGEWGYATHDKGVSLETQAAFIVRQQLANLSQRVPLSIWYDWKNDGLDPAYNEHHFGTVANDLRPKPAYTAVRTLTQQLTGYRLARRLNLTNQADYLFLFVNDQGDQKLAAWTLDAEHTVSLETGLADAANFAVHAWDGQAQPVRLQGQQLPLALGARPQYVTLKKPSPLFQSAAAWQILEPLPSLVEAGAQDALRVKVRLQNPHPHPLQAQLALEAPGLQSAPAAPITLPPNAAAELTAAATVLQRAPAKCEATIALTLTAAGAPNQRWEEKREFTLSNPLEFTLAPTEAGLQLSVRNPARAPFQGAVRLGQINQPLTLTAASPEPNLLLPGPSTGEFDATGAQVRDTQGRIVAELGSHKFKPLALATLQAKLDGDAKTTAQASLALADAPGETGRPAAKAFQLTYQFAEGWRFVRCAPQGQKVILPGRPAALGLWIYGDKSGAALRLRVTDHTGQVFQPTGPNLDWTGWRWVTIELGDFKHATHWGGANNGIPQGDLLLDCPLLLDPVRRKISGKISFTLPTLLYN